MKKIWPDFIDLCYESDQPINIRKLLKGSGNLQVSEESIHAKLLYPTTVDKSSLTDIGRMPVSVRIGIHEIVSTSRDSDLACIPGINQIRQFQICKNFGSKNLISRFYLAGKFVQYPGGIVTI